MSGYSVGVNGYSQNMNIKRTANSKQRSHSSSNNAALNHSHNQNHENNNKSMQKPPYMRNNSDSNQMGGRRGMKDDGYTKEQKMQAAENAIADQYASNVMHGQAINGYAAAQISQSYRNVGNVGGAGMLRNSYQNPNQFMNSGDLITGPGANNSF